MSPIDPLGPILARVRAQALSWKGKGPDPARGDATGSDPGPADLLGTVVAAIARIPAEEPDRGRRAFRLYLQAVVAREFGVQDVSAPEYQDLVDRVLTSMESEESLREAVHRAGELLLQRASQR